MFKKLFKRKPKISQDKAQASDEIDWLQESLNPAFVPERNEETAWEDAVKKNFSEFPKEATSFQGGSKKIFDSAIPPLFPTNNFRVAPGVGAGLIDWYGGQNFIGYPFAAMLSQHWLIDKCCTIPAQDAVRKGFDIVASENEVIPPEHFAKLRRLNKKFKLDDNLIEAERMCRIFGIRVIMFVIENPGWTDEERRDFYRKPFNIDGVQPNSYKGICQIDPNYTVPMFDQRSQADPGSMGYLEPTWWRVSGLYGLEIHKSHLVVIRTCEMPDYLKPSYWYGGVPIPQRIYRRVYASERTADEAPMLTLSKRLLVLSTSMSGAVAKPAAFWARLRLLAKTRDNSSVYAINNETSESVQQFDTSLADFDAVLMSQYQLVAATVNIPAEKLVMTTLKGFNSTGGYQEATYREMVGSLQAEHYTPIVDRNHALIIKSEFSDSFNVEITWEKLDSPTEKEAAEIKSINAQAYKTLWETGGVSNADIRRAIIKDKNSGFDGMTDEDYDDEEDEPFSLDTQEA